MSKPILCYPHIRQTVCLQTVLLFVTSNIKWNNQRSPRNNSPRGAFEFGEEIVLSGRPKSVPICWWARGWSLLLNDLHVGECRMGQASGKWIRHISTRGDFLTEFSVSMRCCKWLIKLDFISYIYEKANNGKQITPALLKSYRAHAQAFHLLCFLRIHSLHTLILFLSFAFNVLVS